MSSTMLYNWSTAGYLMSLFLFAVHVVNVRRLLLKTGVVVVAVSFLVQTAGMVARWSEAGALEVEAAEKALGQSLHGWSWFVVFTQHPPWSNLYEIMVYMSWGIIMTTLMAELRFQIAWVRQMGIILALMALGVASLTDASIKPLVPALKSWWIMIHVISASIAYAAGSIAAFICLLALMKDNERVSKDRFFGAALFCMAVLLIALSGGWRLFLEQAYYVKLLGMAGEQIVTVSNMAQTQKTTFMVPMPTMGMGLIMAVLVHLGAACVLLLGRGGAYIKALYVVPFCASCVVLLIALITDFRALAIDSVEPSLAHHLSPSGPWFISFKSHPWSLFLLILVIALEAFFLLYLLKPDVLRMRLPHLETLELASYRAISLSFFLMTLVLVTGALWAHYAWGRYWAWDPKETGALAIWLNYAIYLHTKRTPGLSGPVSSFIGILGFFVIIIGFLGVNLGLFADGLHTYGNN